MTTYVIVTHPVKDFDTWKNVFDKFESVRKEGGEQSAVALRHVDDPNMVTVENTWNSIDEFQAFFGQEELKAGMAEAGVAGPPTVILANDV